MLPKKKKFTSSICSLQTHKPLLHPSFHMSNKKPLQMRFTQDPITPPIIISTRVKLLGILCGDYNLVSHCFSQNGREIFIPARQIDWCLIHRTGLEPLLTPDSRGRRLFRLYDLSLTPGGDSLFGWSYVQLRLRQADGGACVCLPVCVFVSLAVLFMQIYSIICCYFYLPSCFMCPHSDLSVYCTCRSGLPVKNSHRGNISAPPWPGCWQHHQAEHSIRYYSNGP